MKMKTAKYFSILIASAALLPGICYAEPASNGSQNAPAAVGHDARSAGERALVPLQNQGGVVKNSPANDQAGGQPFSARPRVPAKPMSVGVHNPIIRPSVIQPAGPLLTKAPDHGSTQAVIGGPVTPKIKSTATAAVTGTGMNHKP